jgi:hypothetical protein
MSLPFRNPACPAGMRKKLPLKSQPNVGQYMIRFVLPLGELASIFVFSAVLKAEFWPTVPSVVQFGWIAVPGEMWQPVQSA